MQQRCVQYVVSLASELNLQRLTGATLMLSTPPSLFAAASNSVVYGTKAAAPNSSHLGALDGGSAARRVGLMATAPFNPVSSDVLCIRTP
jgi:hypothetical protein